MLSLIDKSVDSFPACAWPNSPAIRCLSISQDNKLPGSQECKSGRYLECDNQVGLWDVILDHQLRTVRLIRGIATMEFQKIRSKVVVVVLGKTQAELGYALLVDELEIKRVERLRVQVVHSTMLDPAELPENVLFFHCYFQNTR